MPIAPEHAFEEKSTKLLILLPLRTIYFRTFQCETPYILLLYQSKTVHVYAALHIRVEFASEVSMEFRKKVNY